MASVQSNSYGGRYLKLTVVEESYSIPNNTSTIRWTLESIGGSVNYYNIYNCSVVVNGQKVYYSGNTSWNTYRFPAAKGSVSGTLTIKHNQDGSASDVGFTLHGRVYSSGDDNVSGNISLTKIPRAAKITEAPNFNDEQNPTIKFNSPLGYNASSLDVCISLDGGKTDAIKYRGVDKGATEYTFNFTDAERETLRTNCINSNSMKAKFFIRTGIGSQYYYEEKEVTLSIINAMPELESFGYKDTDENIVAFTNDDQVIVQNKSKLQFDFSTLQTKKNATIKEYVLNIYDADFKAGATANSIYIGQVFASTQVPYTFRAYDSRGNYVERKGTITPTPYYAPIFQNVSLKRVSNFYEETKIIAKVDYARVGGKNSLLIYYRYKEKEATDFGSWVEMPNDTEIEVILDNTKAFVFEFKAIDTLGSTTIYDTKINTGIPTMMIDSKLNSVGINCLPSNPYSLEISYLNNRAKVVFSQGLIWAEMNEIKFYFATESYVNSRTSDYIDISSNPLTENNTRLVDSNLQNARYVIVYYTVLLSSTKYINSTIIPVARGNWNMICENGVYGYVGVTIDGNNSSLNVSEYSYAEFGVLGYTIML